MPRKKTTDVNQLSVIIPYRDFENLMNIARTIEEMEKRCKRIDERCARMQLQYVELLEKFAEFNRR